MKKPRILVFSASFGAGHTRAAEAVIEAITNKCPNAEISHLDCWAILSRKLTSIAKDFYIGMLKHTPKLWGEVYYGTAKNSPDSIFHRVFDTTGKTKYLSYIKSFNPDLIICTYHTVAGVIAKLRMKNMVNVPLAVVITDYAVHNQWIHDGVDLYIVGSEEIHQDLVMKGFDPTKVRVTGIPVSPRFETNHDRSQIRANLGLSPDLPTCLVMAGAYGVLNELKDLCQFLAHTPIPFQTIVVCGQDANLYRSLDSVVESAVNPIARFGFVSNVEEFMGAADVMITKAGGLTVSEALTKRLPTIIYKPIPGVEQENAAFLQKIGAGRTAYSQAELKQILFELIDQPDELNSMARAAVENFPGRSAEKAIIHMLQLIDTSWENIYAS